MDAVTLTSNMFYLLRPFIIAGLILLGAVFAFILYASRDRIMRGFFGRRKYDSEFVEALKRQDFLITQLMDIIRNNTEAMAGMRQVVEVQLRMCREDCQILHRRIDKEVLKGGNAQA